MVSIIMAAYNAEKTIEASIKSVIAQSYTNWELIVVNDHSQDETCFIIDRFVKKEARIHVIINRINLGVSASRKRALESAKGEWIAILDSDDIWLPNKLEKQINFANRHNVDFIFTGSSFIDDEGKHINWELHVPTILVYRDLLKQNLISNSSVLIKKELYGKHYVINDKIHEDFAMWLDITKAGNDAYGIDEPLLIYRLSKNSRSRNKIKSAIMRWNTYRKTGINPLIASYFMWFYFINGLNKYRNLNKCKYRF